MSALEVAKRIAERLHEDGIPYGIGGALALGAWGANKDVTDLEQLIARNPDMDLAYVRGWLTKMVPAGDRRLQLLDNLEHRFKKQD